MQRNLQHWYSCICLISLIVLVSTLVHCKSGPIFSVTELKVDPSESWYGDIVQVSVVIHNIGNMEGKYTPTFKVDDSAKSVLELTLASGEKKTVTLTLNEKYGDHTVSIGGLTKTFKVKIVEPLAVVSDSILPIKLYTLSNITSIKSGSYSLVATGGVPPYEWSWDWPELLVTDAFAGSPAIRIIYRPINMATGKGVGIVSGLVLTKDGVIPESALFLSTDEKPEFYPEKTVKIPVTINLKDSRGNLASKKFKAEFALVY